MIRPSVYYEPAADFGEGFHCGPVDGTDYTLCGFSLDGAQGAIDEVKSKPPRVDCPRCLSIIHYCRKLSARTFHPPY
ncbi:MAG: hypothetical protein JWQ94_3737 [Tardiphaga sp.]|nr:hypothetical protein [Tardiphaga sp.]